MAIDKNVTLPEDKNCAPDNVSGAFFFWRPSLCTRRILFCTLIIGSSNDPALISCACAFFHFNHDQAVAEYQTVSWRDGRCLNTTTYVYYALSPAFESYYKLKKVGTAANNYRDGRDPRWATWTESVWGLTSARIFQMESPQQQLGTLLGSIFYFLATVGLVYAMSKFLVQSPESLAVWEGQEAPASPASSGHPLRPL